MTRDRNISPVDWYVGTYLLRFVELDDTDKDDPEKRFRSWENTVLVQATSLDLAFKKVEKIGRASTKPYRGGPDEIRVRWTYEGITSLLPDLRAASRRRRDCMGRTSLAEVEDPAHLGEGQAGLASVDDERNRNDVLHWGRLTGVPAGTLSAASPIWRRIDADE
jgi:hypothetical protein